jgi:hypothetical protein
MYQNFKLTKVPAGDYVIVDFAPKITGAGFEVTAMV